MRLEQRARLHRHERPMSRRQNLQELGAVAGLIAIGGAYMLVNDLINNKPQSHIDRAPIERVGGHQSGGMPSSEHLQKFTQEHGVTLNQK